MKLQEQVGKKIGNKIYPKHVVVIPSDKIEEAGFKKGDELEVEAKKGEIRLKRK